MLLSTGLDWKDRQVSGGKVGAGLAVLAFSRRRTPCRIATGFGHRYEP